MKQILFSLLLLGLTLNVLSQSALWSDYLNSNPRGQGAKLANYSYAGYHYCEKELPTINNSDYTYFDISNYGAIADDDVSDRKAVLKAIEAAEKHEGKSVVYFPEGKFNLNGKDDFGQHPIVITRNNVVLKGAGQHLTELFFEEPCFIGELSHITFLPSFPYDSYWRGDKALAEVVSFPEKGGFHLNVTNSASFKPGMIVNIDANLHSRSDRGKGFFLPHNPPQGVKDIEDYFLELHQVEKVVGNTVYFKEPIQLDLPHMQDVKIWSVEQSIEESGIQDLTISGNYQEQFKHHSGSRFGEKYMLIRFISTRNCWVKNVNLKNYSSAIKIWRSISNSFLNINLQGNTGHGSINGAYTYGNLIAYARENTQTHHGFGGDHCFANSVFLRCNQYDGPEAHCAWPRASLYDMNEGGFKPRPGGATYFPHHGKDLCFWNWNVTKPGSKDYWDEDARYGSFMPFVVAGLHGEPFNIINKESDLVAYESLGSKITSTESLFEAQLKDRLGELPAWLKEQSELFESISRYSSINISAPSNFTQLNNGSTISVSFNSHPKMDRTIVKTIDLWISKDGLQSGFKKIATQLSWSDKMSFSTELRGTVIIKATMLNSRNEVEESDPITLFIGDKLALNKLPIVKAAMMTHNARVAMYSDFVSAGGAEASSFPNNSAYHKYKNGTPFYQVESDFYAQQLETYAAYGQEKVKPELEKIEHASQVNKLLDGKSSTTIDNIYGYLGSMVQFDLGSEYSLSKLELDWKNTMTNSVKLEVQTSLDSLAWYSVTNDEPLWEFGVQHIGKTLSRAPLPSGSTSSIYLPQKRCRYVRLLIQSMPNGSFAEIRFYGNDVPLLQSLQVNDAHISSWDPHTFNYTVAVEKGKAPTFNADPKDENNTIKIDEPDSYPGVCKITVSSVNGSTTTYKVSITVIDSYIEDFDKLLGDGSFEGSFIGNNNFEWWVTARIGEYLGSGQSVYYYPTQDGVYSEPIPGGLSEISFEALNYRKSGDRRISVYVNDSLIIDSLYSGSEKYMVEKSGLTFTEPVSIKIMNSTESLKILAIDNISWKGYAPDRNVWLDSISINNMPMEDFKYDSLSYRIDWDDLDNYPGIIGIPQSENATVEVSYPDSIHGNAIIKVTAANGAWAEYRIFIDCSILSNAWLQDLTINGESISDFSYDSLSYIIEWNDLYNYPEIIGVPQYENATVEVIYPDSIHGNIVIKVTATNGENKEYLVFIDSHLSVSTPSLAAVNIVPNPTKGMVTIQSNNRKIDKITIFNCNGRMVFYSNKFVSNINISSFPQGLYFFQLKNNDGAQTIKKIIKE